MKRLAFLHNQTGHLLFVENSKEGACSYESITFIPFEYKDILRLINSNIYAARYSHRNQIKQNLHFFKVVQNINQWEWIFLNNRRYFVLLARLRIGCVDLNDYFLPLRKDMILTVITVLM